MSEERDQVATQSTKVLVSGYGREERQIDHDPITTVADYLKAAEVSVGRGQQVLVNGTPATLEETVRPGATVVVADAVTNG